MAHAIPEFHAVGSETGGISPNRLFFLGALLAIGLIASPSHGKEISDGVFFNAYLTQAWGITDGIPILGLDEDGRFDYRSAALLFRFQPSKRDSVVIQLAHESLGGSPFQAFRQEIELDWGFYQRNLGLQSKVRVGRLPIPFGLYNELRDVGTSLEFFRPPVGIYYEGAFSSETLDGISFSHSFMARSGWCLEIDLYVGEWERNESAAGLPVPGEARDGIGAQLWLETPATGLRFGAAFQTFDQQGGEGILRIGETDFDYYLLSTDLDFDRFWLRAEILRIETSFLATGEYSQNSYYILAGFKPTERLSLHLLWEDSLGKADGTRPRPPLRIDPYYQDLALSASLQIFKNALVRLEVHHAKSFAADLRRTIDGPSFEVDYAIASVAVSF